MTSSVPGKIFVSALLAWWLLVSASLAVDSKSSAVDFSYAPPEWQTAICLPDDPYKSLVDRSGELLYHYGQGGREFATRISVQVVSNAVWSSQELYSPRVPIVRTKRTAQNLNVLEETFAVPRLKQVGNWNVTNRMELPRNDLLLIHVKNTGSEPIKLQPRLVVDTTLPFRFDPSNQWVEVNHHETITASLKMTGLAEEPLLVRLI